VRFFLESLLCIIFSTFSSIVLKASNALKASQAGHPGYYRFIMSKTLVTLVKASLHPEYYRYIMSKATISSALVAEELGGLADLGDLGEGFGGLFGLMLQIELKSALAILL